MERGSASIPSQQSTLCPTVPKPTAQHNSELTPERQWEAMGQLADGGTHLYVMRKFMQKGQNAHNLVISNAKHIQACLEQGLSLTAHL